MSSFILKLIAILTMTIDHIGFSFFPSKSFLRIIGRIAMPLFAFQIGVGFKKTHSKPKYILRMFLIAIISELPYLLLRYTSNYLSFSLNICATFTLALLALYFMTSKNKFLMPLAIIPILCSYYFSMDYGIYGVLLVIFSYFFQDKKIWYTISMIFVATTYYYFKNSWLQLYMPLALPFIYLYNGKKGKDFKYWFYAFYPAHMLLFSIIKILIT